MDPISLAILGYIIRGKLRLAWRAVLVWLRIRRITPRLGEHGPRELVVVAPLGDTGGGYRPKHRPQDPSKDPREPFGGESSSKGQDHGWSNCTQSAGADALAYQTFGALELWGGDLRHEQGDLDGGTDLYDLANAWEAYGETLKIRSGAGWQAVKDAHEERRAIVIQGIGNVPGSGTFDGGHACCIGIETHSDGRWLWGDPCVSDWQWIEPSKIRSWAEAWQSSIAFATSRKAEDDPEPPEPPPADCDDELDDLRLTLEAECQAELEELSVRLEHEAEAIATGAGDALVGAWLAWLQAPATSLVDRWDAGAWHDAELELEELLDGEPEDPCAPWAPAHWSRGGFPFPVAEALRALVVPASWDGSAWRAAAWRMPPDAARRRSR